MPRGDGGTGGIPSVFQYCEAIIQRKSRGGVDGGEGERAAAAARAVNSPAPVGCGVVGCQGSAGEAGVAHGPSEVGPRGRWRSPRHGPRSMGSRGALEDFIEMLLSDRAGDRGGPWRRNGGHRVSGRSLH